MEGANMCVINLSAAEHETGKRYQVYLWQVHQVYSEVVQVSLYSWSDNIKYLKNIEEKCEKIKKQFFVDGFGYLSEVITFS